jgi:hypothetical protein
VLLATAVQPELLAAHPTFAPLSELHIDAIFDQKIWFYSRLLSTSDAKMNRSACSSKMFASLTHCLFSQINYPTPGIHFVKVWVVRIASFIAGISISRLAIST